MSLASAETRFIIDSNRQYPVVVAENDENGELLFTYAYGAGILPLSRTNVETGETFSYITDQKKVLMLADSEGNIVAEYQYDSYGNPIGLSGPESRLEDFIFGGNTFDPSSGFYNARARDYDPKIGRFTQMDTYQGNIQNPATLHKYAYGNSDPVNNIDPSGNMSNLMSFGAAFSISGILATLAQPSYKLSSGAYDSGIGKNVEDAKRTATAMGLTYIMASSPGTGVRLATLLGAISPGNTESCEDEWKEARRTCFDLIREQMLQDGGRKKKRKVTGVTGGYTNVEECAAGLVSELCGGNGVDRG